MDALALFVCSLKMLRNTGKGALNLPLLFPLIHSVNIVGAACVDEFHFESQPKGCGYIS